MAKEKEKKYIIDNHALMAEWDWEKNAKLGLNPKKLTYGSNKKSWWICDKGHEWQAKIADRNNRKRGCPYCAKQIVIIGENDLKTVNPLLAQIWNYEKNIEITPENVFPYSNRIVWWKCSKGHEWQARIADQNKSHNCPICSGKRILAGFNDLTTTHPSLIEEWDFEKNKDISPTEISKGSEKKIWWKCKQGHTWHAAVYSRTAGIGCPHCAKELQSSFPEKALYYYIKKIFPDAIANYRSNLLKSLELDIFIPSLKIGIEYDGERWHQNIEKDLQKNKLCSESGIVLIRIREPSCPILFDELSICIYRESKKIGLDNTIKLLFVSICNISKIECTIDVDLVRDNIDILNLLTPIEKENNILLSMPNLTKEWDYQKNGNLLPNMITAGSDKKAWWICPLGHSYYSSVSSRTKGRGCPICAGKVILTGYNDFESRCPDLLNEWDYEKNTILPNSIAHGSDKKVWWKCDNNHSYFTSINNKKAGAKCPFCSGKKVLAGFNDLATTHTTLIEEWDHQKNNLAPTSVSAGSHKKIWWICKKCGNEWQAPIYNRSAGHGCPHCAKQKK